MLLEADEPDARWKKSWDSFRLNTPNRTLSLPGLGYTGNNPDEFSTHGEIIGFLRKYAQHFRLPVFCDSRVRSVQGCDGGFEIKTPDSTIGARVVILATGEYTLPRLPKYQGNIPSSVSQLHAMDYRNPHVLKPGAVLVVGGGQSGVQIAEDLQQSGRKVY